MKAPNEIASVLWVLLAAILVGWVIGVVLKAPVDILP